jgi:hypothetical protein
MAQPEPFRRTIEEIQRSTLELIDWEAERLQEQALLKARNAGKKIVAAVVGTALLLIGVQSAVLALLFVLHERATQFVVRPGVAWPLAGLATALIVMGVSALVYGLTGRSRSLTKVSNR